VTPFRIEHEFRASSAEEFWDLFFDDEHAAALDEHTDIEEREVVERRDEGDTLYRTIKLRPKRQLPGWFRKLTKKELAYTQKEVFHKSDNRVEIEIVPTIFAGKTEIKTTYTLEEVAPGRFSRVFEGSISIRVPMFGRRIEKSIIEDMKRSYEVGAAVTQRRLDERSAS
jgi:hypothetical protein